VVAGSSVVIKVLRNRRSVNSVIPGYTSNPFSVVSNHVLDNFPLTMLTPQLQATCGANSMGLGPTITGAWGCELADLDADGDLDVVVANAYAQNVAYLNYGAGSGTGQFASRNTPIHAGDPADEVPAVAFPTLTQDWGGPSTTSAALEFLYAQSLPPCAGPITWFVPGKRIDMTTGVDVADVNADGRVDVAFSNRNDLDEQALRTGLAYSFSPSYDYLFLNHSYFSFDGTYVWPFDCVEKIGNANDGTGYGKFEQMNPSIHSDGDNRPDWLDGNWENATPTDAGLQHVFFGNRLVSRSWAALDLVHTFPSPIPFDLDLSLSDNDAAPGNTYTLFVSCSGASSPPTSYLGFNVPLANAVPVTGFSGAVPATDFPLTGGVSSPCGGAPCELFFIVLLTSGSTGKATNITRIPVRCP
jgi:hypothetical protein